MTQTTTPELFATADEVAAMIGVMADTLPIGPAMIEETDMTYDTVGSSHKVSSTKTKATAYVWRDADEKKIAEVRIAKSNSKISYQKIEYDVQGCIASRHDQFADGHVNKALYHDNGAVRYSRHDTDYAYHPGVLHSHFDREGKLHNVSGYATYIKTSRFTFEEEYFIGGTQYAREQFDAHPERIAHLRQKQIDQVAARWYNRLIAAVKKALSFGKANNAPVAVTEPAERTATLRADALITIAEKLPEADKLRLLKAISSSFNGEDNPEIEDATIKIVAPTPRFTRKRP